MDFHPKVSPPLWIDTGATAVVPEFWFKVGIEERLCLPE
jgi:hypothetical protein